MISQAVAKYLRKTAEKGYFWGTARFYFSPEENLLIVSKSWRRNFFPAFNFASSTSYAVFLLGRLMYFQYFGKGEISGSSKVFLEMIGLIVLIPPFCCQPCFIRREETFASFTNQYLIYYREIEDPGHETLEKMFAYVFRFFSVLEWIVSPMTVLMSILRPDIPIFLSSPSYSTESLKWTVRVMSPLQIAYTVATWWSNASFIMAWFLGYIFCTLVAIHSLRSEATALSTTKFAERYRCLQLLEGKANEILNVPLATAKALCLLVTIRCMCGTVTTNGFVRILNLNYSFGLVVFLIVAFKALGQVHEESKEVLWKKRKLLSDKWFRRFHRSCRPLKIQVV